MAKIIAKAAHSFERAPYAQRLENTKGRSVDEPDAQDRTPYQRDRDRILFSDAFRRLQYKRQVFMNSEEGEFRTRLTHTLEVAQLTRSVCRNLKLDEDLGECCALAHDIGHPPFGHAGEDALNDCMADYGGFDHNVQALRILRYLEQTYVAFDGLNLSWEVLEGIAKHNGPMLKKYHKMDLFDDLDPATNTSLEAQVAAECDQLAYTHHDLDDGLSTGKLHIEDVLKVKSFRRAWEEVAASFPKSPHTRRIKETIRRMIARNVRDILNISTSKIHQAGVKNVEDVREQAEMLVGFSETTREENAELKAFLMEHLYRHTSVNRFNFQAHRMVRDLFGAFMNHRKMLPANWRTRLPEDETDIKAKARVVCDYIACLTDRSAVKEHARLFAPLRGN